MSDPGPPQRVLKKDLRGLNSDGRLCEVCEKHMHVHEWADLDYHGFVVACSMQEVLKND